MKTAFHSDTVPSPGASLDLLKTLFSPTSVAVIGASNVSTKLITYRPISYMKREGFKKPIFPINPKYSEVQGFPAYSSVAELPEVPQVAIVALPRPQVLQVLEDCAARGTQIAIVYSSGFAEVKDGLDLQRELTALSRRTGMRVVGPNCQGIANFENGFLPCFSTTFSSSSPMVGQTAIISQSGAVAGMLSNKWSAVGGGLKYWAASGNEADLTVAEIALAALEDPDIEQVMVYVESLRRPDLWELLARRAEELDKWVLAHRPISSSKGWAAARRHTGAGTEPEDARSSKFPQGSRIVVAQTLDQLIETAQLINTGKKLQGNNVGVISNSGGLGVMTAEKAIEAGFELNALDEKTVEKLSTVLPTFASLENPVDVTAQLLNDPTLLGTALPAMFDDDAIDVVLLSLGAVGEGYDVKQILDDVTQAHEQSKKIFVVIWVGSDVEISQELGKRGVPVYLSAESAVAALAKIAPKQTPVKAYKGISNPSFDQLEPGATYISSELMVSGAEVDAYAGVARQAGHKNNVHASKEAAALAGYQGRVVAGLHTLTYLAISGDELGLWAHSQTLANFSNVVFESPLIEEQKVRVCLQVRSKKRLKRSARGLVEFRFEITEVGTERRIVHGFVSYVFD